MQNEQWSSYVEQGVFIGMTILKLFFFLNYSPGDTGLAPQLHCCLAQTYGFNQAAGIHVIRFGGWHKSRLYHGSKGG